MDGREGVPTWNTAEGLDDKFKTVEYGLLIGLLNGAENVCVNSSVDMQTETTVSRPEKKRVKKDDDSGQGSLWGVFSKVKQKCGNFMDDLLDDKNI